MESPEGYVTQILNNLQSELQNSFTGIIAQNKY